MSGENYPGSVGTPGGIGVVDHLPIDRARPRWGDEDLYGGDEETVRDVSKAAAFAGVPDPDASIHDPVVGINTRASTVPLWMTVRRGFEDVPFLGQKGPDIAPSAKPDPLQSMEQSPQYERSTFRVTPGPWDEDLVTGGR